MALVLCRWTPRRNSADVVGRESVSSPQAAELGEFGPAQPPYGSIQQAQTQDTFERTWAKMLKHLVSPQG